MFKIIISLLVFSILIVVHEFGHFIVAKKSGVFVEEFAVGMGPKLISKKIGETVYSLRLFPIGGFCRMLGEDADSDDDRAFGNKSVVKRMLIVVAGAFMNFLLALVIIFVLKNINGYIDPTIKTVLDGYPAQEAGLQAGDVIKKINGKKVIIYEDLTMILSQNADKPITVTVERDSQLLNFNIVPKQSEEGQWLIGFSPVGYVKGNIFETMKQSFGTLWFYIKYTIIGFVQLITGQVATSEMTGAIGIVNIMGETYEAGLKYSVGVAIQSIAEIAALISANLGVVNLLPLPALDGGRFVFLLIEAIRRKPVSAEKEGMVHFIGFVALMILAVFVAYNDVLNLL